MDSVDHFFNTLKPEQKSAYDTIDYIRKHGGGELNVCPYEISDSLLYPFAMLDFDFLHPTADSSFYDHGAVKKTLAAMRQMDWSAFAHSLDEQLTEKAGEDYGFCLTDMSDLWEEIFSDWQKLFEKAAAENLFVFSYCDDERLKDFY